MRLKAVTRKRQHSKQNWNGTEYTPAMPEDIPGSEIEYVADGTKITFFVDAEHVIRGRYTREASVQQLQDMLDGKASRGEPGRMRARKYPWKGYTVLTGVVGVRDEVYVPAEEIRRILGERA